MSLNDFAYAFTNCCVLVENENNFCHELKRYPYYKSESNNLMILKFFVKFFYHKFLSKINCFIFEHYKFEKNIFSACYCSLQY